MLILVITGEANLLWPFLVQVQGFYTDETVTFKYKRPVKVWGL